MEKEDGTLVSSSWVFQQINLETIHWLLQTYLFPAVHQIQLHLQLRNIPTYIYHLYNGGWFTDSQTIIINAIPAKGDKSNFLYTLDENLPQTE
jgi:hypothetical protein